MPKESALQAKCLRHARGLGIICGKIDMASIRGWPDTLLLLPDGRTTYVEFKLPTGALRPEQKRTIQKMRDHHADVIIIRDYESFKASVTLRLVVGTDIDD